MTSTLHSPTERLEQTAVGRSKIVGRTAIAHPVATVTAVALAARFLVSGVSFVVHGDHLIPDEGQYVGLAAAVARSGDAERWLENYGQSLYEATWAFSAPLRVLFDLFGVSRLWGQLLAAVFGAATAGLTTAIALEVAARRWMAFAASLIVALLPSQVVHSSTVLRESMIWAALALVGLGMARAVARRGAGAVEPLWYVATGLLALTLLRDQTAVAAAWAVALAAPIVALRRVRVVASLIALAVLVPYVGGLGFAGYSLVQSAVPSLSTQRAELTLDAESGFRELIRVPAAPTTASTTTTTRAPAGGPSAAGGVSGGTSTSVSRPTTGTAPDEEQQPVVVGGDGHTYVVEQDATRTLNAVGPGLVAFVLRPFPWEVGRTAQNTLAGVEAVLWYLLYGIAAFGVVIAMRVRPAEFVFPAVVLVAVAAIAAISQGNVGTAFRHRGQILWAVALFAGMGIDHLVQRRNIRVAASRQAAA